MKYKVSTYAKIHGVTMRTVWNWINKGELEIERTSTGRIRIVVDENKEKTIAVYARVSSSENKSNLIAQKDRVVSYCMAKGYKISKVVMEVGSGALNILRKEVGEFNYNPIEVCSSPKKLRIGLS